MAISCKMKMDWYRETKFSSHIMLKTFGETDMDERCRVFTPLDIAEYMLDIVGYKNAVYGKKIVENSCGAGNILCAIVKRYIESLAQLTMAACSTFTSTAKSLAGDYEIIIIYPRNASNGCPVRVIMRVCTVE